MNPFYPSTALLCKLGSIVVHAEEMVSPTGHGYDKVAMEQLLNDSEVVEWLKAMNAQALLPQKRTMEDVRLYARSKKSNSALKQRG